jgi:hypothetical protein
MSLVDAPKHSSDADTGEDTAVVYPLASFGRTNSSSAAAKLPIWT